MRFIKCSNDGFKNVFLFKKSFFDIILKKLILNKKIQNLPNPFKIHLKCNTNQELNPHFIH